MPIDLVISPLIGLYRVAMYVIIRFIFVETLSLWQNYLWASCPFIIVLPR